MPLGRNSMVPCHVLGIQFFSEIKATLKIEQQKTFGLKNMFVKISKVRTDFHPSAGFAATIAMVPQESEVSRFEPSKCLQKICRGRLWGYGFQPRAQQTTCLLGQPRLQVAVQGLCRDWQFIAVMQCGCVEQKKKLFIKSDFFCRIHQNKTYLQTNYQNTSTYIHTQIQSLTQQ